MPYRMVYEPAPKNMELLVYPDLPKEYAEQPHWLTIPFRWARHTETYEEMYFCDHDCKGWIEGNPNKYHVNTLEPEHLAGRRGEEFYCRRCGRQIAFVGLMS